MRRAAILFAASIIPVCLLAQAPPTPRPAAPAKVPTVIIPGLAEAAAPEAITSLVKTWLDAWNKLDGTAAATQKFVDLYAPDATHEVGSPGRPLGPEFFAAPEGIRKMAEEFGKTCTEAAYRLETFTANEKASDLIYYADGPWGGPAIAVPYTGAFTVRETKRRYFYPGVAVFHIKAGKIIYARFYQDRDELAEVRP